MFNNIERKIKGLAFFYTIVGIIGSIIGAIFYWVNSDILTGFIILILEYLHPGLVLSYCTGLAN